MLLETALSISKQTLQPEQWIVYIDDDLSKYQKSIDLIKKLVPQSKIIGGVAIGRAKALIKCHLEVKTDLVGWVDDDDWLDSQCLEICKKTNSTLCYTQYYLVKNKKLFFPDINNIEYDFTKLNRLFLPFHFRLFSLDLYKLVGGINENLNSAIDFELTARMCWEVQPIKINRPLYYYRVHQVRMSTNLRGEQKENANKVKRWVNQKFLELA